MGTYVPEKILTNKDLEQMIDTNDQWIRSRTGIKERRIAAPEQAASDLAIPAAVVALKKAGVAPAEVDLIIVATSTPDMCFPSTACAIQHKLGCTKAGAFDLSAACSGFVYALSVARQFIATGTAKYVLVIASEVFSRVLNWQDRETCILFGDGAGAVVLGAVAPGQGIISAHLAADGAGGHLLTLPGCGSRLPLTPDLMKQGLHYVTMEGKEVFKFAVRVMEAGALKVLELAGMEKDDLDLIIPHQANSRIIEHVAKKLHFPLEKIMVNVDKYGNTSAASIPLALDDALRQGRIKPGDNILMIAFGGGLTWAATIVKWV